MRMRLWRGEPWRGGWPLKWKTPSVPNRRLWISAKCSFMKTPRSFSPGLAASEQALQFGDTLTEITVNVKSRSECFVERAFGTSERCRHERRHGRPEACSTVGVTGYR